MVDIICNRWYKNRVIFLGFTQCEVLYIIYGFFKKACAEYLELLNVPSENGDFFSDFSSVVLCAFLCRCCKDNFSTPPEKISELIYKCICENAFDTMMNPL